MMKANILRTFIESLSIENELLITTIIEGLDEVTQDQPFDVKTFKTLPSFAARTRYARAKLPKSLGTGSSRIVFDLGNDKVLKLAKNAKGIAQNGVEDDGYVQQSGIAATVYDSDDEDLWIIADKVDNVTEKEFGQLLGVSFKFFCDAVLTHEADVRGNSRSPRRLTREQMQPLWENEFICGIFDLMGSMEVLGGDLTRLGSYGKCRGQLKLRDAGFTKTVAKEHYSNKGKFESVEKKEYLIGGRADGMTPEDIARKHGLPVEDIEEQLELGDEAEMEHTNNPAIAHEIAMDQEAEIPDYYTRLAKMEKQAGITESIEGINAFRNITWKDIRLTRKNTYNYYVNFTDKQLDDEFNKLCLEDIGDKTTITIEHDNKNTLHIDGLPQSLLGAGLGKAIIECALHTFGYLCFRGDSSDSLKHVIASLSKKYETTKSGNSSICMTTEPNNLHEGQGWYPPANKPKIKFDELSFKDQTIFAIIKMFKAMSPKHQKELFDKLGGKIAKWQLEQFPDDYLIRIKMDAEHLRDVEKDVLRFSPAQLAKNAKKKERDDKRMDMEYDVMKQEQRNADAEANEWKQFAIDRGEIDEDGNFLK